MFYSTRRRGTSGTPPGFRRRESGRRQRGRLKSGFVYCEPEHHVTATLYQLRPGRPSCQAGGPGNWRYLTVTGWWLGPLCAKESWTNG